MRKKEKRNETQTGERRQRKIIVKLENREKKIGKRGRKGRESAKKMTNVLSFSFLSEQILELVRQTSG